MVFGIDFGPEGDQCLDALCMAMNSRLMQWGSLILK